MSETFETIRGQKRLLYEYIRGSHLYGLNNEDSDVDTSGLFIASKESFMGIGHNYHEEVSDTRHDTTWYELGKFMRMALKSNPTVLEALFIPKNKIITEPNPLIIPLLENRDVFITKECFKPFVAYAKQQIYKARGLNKKIVNPITERLTPFDFAYTFHKQGSYPIAVWLEERGLDKNFCGLVNIPNMHNVYGVYYDWGAHMEHYGVEFKALEDIMFVKWGEFSENVENFAKFITAFYDIHTLDDLKGWYEKHREVLHYRGMCLEEATDMRGSSVSKGEKPLCHMSYNEDGFKSHCKKYREYKEWEKYRNPKRYESNLDKNYDSKNMMHCVRLIHMGKEIAEGQGVNLERTWDKDFLMDIRNHKFEYDELMEKVEADNAALDKAIAESTLKEKIDINFVNDLLIDIRKKAYGLL